MHCQAELEADLGYSDFLPDTTLFKWFNDRYSTSKHLLTLYSIARGIDAKTIVEVGFGRSSFVLAKAAGENQGHLISCDTRDFSYLLNEREKQVTTFINGKAEQAWSALKGQGADFIFLDYLSNDAWTPKFAFNAFYNAFNHLKQNGVLCVHDTIVEKYSVKNLFDRLSVQRFGLLPNRDLEMVRLPYNYGLGIVRRLKESPLGVVTDNFIKKTES